MNRFHAERIAKAFVECIKPATTFRLVCGSIRRKEPSANDIDVVVVPTMVPAPTLFDAGELVSTLDPLLKQLVSAGEFELDDELVKNGDRCKRFRKGGLPIDLHIVTPPRQLGWIVALRTGPESFVKKLVLPRESGGFLPLDAKIAGGQLFRRGKLVETPTEESFFAAMGMRNVDPEFRDSYSPFAKGAQTFTR